MSRTINKTIARYQNPEVAEHLASNYVLGQLSPLATKRLEKLRQDYEYQILDERIFYWENKLSSLNNDTQELEPLPETWTAIQRQLGMVEEPKKSAFSWANLFSNKYFGAVSFACCLMLAVVMVGVPTEEDPLSYVAVLESSDKNPQIVAATYGNSKNLVLDIIDLPDIGEDEIYELWVTSKTDNQVRSLGEVPRDLASFQRQLSEAEWRLITDSAFLILSVEEVGGSPIGEPSDTILSRGLCIRLSAWEAQT